MKEAWKLDFSVVPRSVSGGQRMAKVVTGQVWLVLLFSVVSLAVLGGCFVLEGVGREKLKEE